MRNRSAVGRPERFIHDTQQKSTDAYRGVISHLPKQDKQESTAG